MLSPKDHSGYSKQYFQRKFKLFLKLGLNRVDIHPVNCVVLCLHRALPWNGQKTMLEIHFSTYIHC